MTEAGTGAGVGVGADAGVGVGADAARLLDLLRRRGLSVAVAESLTGGLVVASLVAVPGASDVVRGGVVAYATEAKSRLLGVDADLLAEHGAIDPEVAQQMAERAREVLGGEAGPASVGLATTGVAGPDAAEGHPAGTVHLAVASEHGVWVESLVLGGDRDAVRAEATRRVIALALDAL